MNKLTKILNRPFPLIESTKEKILISVGIGIFIFLAIFQPFGLTQYDGNIIITSIGFGFITSFVVLFNFFITMNLFKDYFLPEKWNIGKALVFTFIMIIPISVLNLFYFYE